tara:strand:- start:1318 stop:1545 length:228 start_codon:yes stop_codon:yes gene_type:complete
MAEELNEETQVQDSTQVEEVDVNIDEIFGNVGAENVMLPTEEEEENQSQFFLNQKNLTLRSLTRLRLQLKLLKRR